jgi:hypothetical protein
MKNWKIIFQMISSTQNNASSNSLFIQGLKIFNISDNKLTLSKGSSDDHGLDIESHLSHALFMLLDKISAVLLSSFYYAKMETKN